MQPIIKKTAVHFTERPAPRAAAGAACPGPGVELLNRDGVVHGLQVTCACGEVTTVELEYAPGDAPPAAPGGPPLRPRPSEVS